MVRVLKPGARVVLNVYSAIERTPAAHAFLQALDRYSERRPQERSVPNICPARPTRWRGAKRDGVASDSYTGSLM
jgi:hypothetical protein